MRRKDRVSLKATELPDSYIQQIKSASMSPEHNHLNELLKQCPSEKMVRDKEDEDWLK